MGADASDDLAEKGGSAKERQRNNRGVGHPTETSTYFVSKLFQAFQL